MNNFLITALLCLAITFSAAQSTISFSSNNEKLNEAFTWAQQKALSFAHDSNDAVGVWYEAALPNREAFCMRDVSHQAIGAQLLGLGKHNFNMFQKFAMHISAEKDYCSYWEINRYNKPAPVDYENDKDFWYNLPANFDVIYNAWRLYRWTGDRRYIDNEEFRKFYELSLDEYVSHWQLSPDKITKRSREMHSREAKRFGSSRGIPTYNEGGRGETLLGIDLTASMLAANHAYAEMLKSSGDANSKSYYQKAKQQAQFLENFWWDKQKQQYRSIQYADKSFDYFMVGDDQAFLHYLLYFNALNDPLRIQQLASAYRDNYKSLIVELKSYLPIIFYENGDSQLANEMIISLCSAENKRRDYPENSFTVIEHITRGLMGIEVDATQNLVSTLPRLASPSDYAELKNVPVLSGKISVLHEGNKKTRFINHSNAVIKWKVLMPGSHDFLYVNGKQRKCMVETVLGQKFSFVIVEVASEDAAEVLIY